MFYGSTNMAANLIRNMGTSAGLPPDNDDDNDNEFITFAVSILGAFLVFGILMFGTMLITGNL
jgi:hypothetical protein